MTEMLAPTLREQPAGAVNASHILMLRSGLVRQLASGFFSMLPLGFRVMKKLESIIDDELQGVGGQRVVLPLVIPGDLWRQTGRWESVGEELFRLQDRKKNDFCLGSTHEEAITALVRDVVQSYRDLPLRLYQIAPKFRDELRPRAGLLRGREFVMKDMYSFDDSPHNAMQAYQQVSGAYERIFTRIGVPFVKAQADSGDIGGSLSHEFHIQSPVGEDHVLTCPVCAYAANEESAVGTPPGSPVASQLDLESGDPRVGDDAQETSSALAALFPTLTDCQVESSSFRINLVMASKGQADQVEENIRSPVFVLLPRDRQMNPYFLKRELGQMGFTQFELQSSKEAKEFVSTLKDAAHVPVLMDDGLQLDLPATKVLLRQVQPGDVCMSCAKGVLESTRGIEIGHIFYLGDQYSKPLSATFLDPDKNVKNLQMGCYGIGVSRLMAAIIEVFHDKKGIKWPSCVAPYKVAIVPIGSAEDENHSLASTLADTLNDTTALAGEILLDDRAMGPGARLRDMELIGIPWVVVFGRKVKLEGLVEVQCRRTGDRHEVPQHEVLAFLQTALH